MCIAEEYVKEYEATNLLNCFFGLLIVPNSKCFDLIPLDSLEDFYKKWGIAPDAVKSHTDHLGKRYNPDNLTYNIRFFVRDLRNALCHFHIAPIPETGEVTAFKFANKDTNFEAEISLGALKTFVGRLAKTLSDM